MAYIFSICVIITRRRTYTPWLVAHRTVVIAAGAPSEKVAVNILVIAVLARGGTKIVPLVVCEFPIGGGGAADILQVALREQHLLVVAHREDTIDDSY